MRYRESNKHTAWEPISDLEHILRPGVDQRRFVPHAGVRTPWVFFDCAPNTTLRQWLEELNPADWQFRKPTVSESADISRKTRGELENEIRKLNNTICALRLEKAALESQIESKRKTAHSKSKPEPLDFQITFQCTGYLKEMACGC